MKNHLLILVFFLISVITWPSLAQIDIQEIKTEKGVKAWFLPEKKLPVFSLTFSFRAGSAYDPQDCHGMASILAQMLMEGTARRNGYQLQNDLLERAVELSFTASQDRIIVNLRTPLQSLDYALATLKEILTEPFFSADDLQRVRSQSSAYLHNHVEKPEVRLELAHRRMLMGAHPYTGFETGKIEDLPNITADKLRIFFKEHLTRDSILIGVCGQIGRQELVILLQNLFDDLPEKPSYAVLTPPSLAFKGEIETVTADIPQALVQFSHPGLAHSHPDFMKLYILNHIIGGSSSSRLFQEIREKRGLVYTINSELVNLEKLHLLSGYFGTENRRAQQTIDLVKETLESVSRQGITEQELQDAKTFLIGAFPRVFSSTKQTASALHAYQVYGLDQKYFKNRTQLINNISLKELNSFTTRFLETSKIAFTIVGKPG